MPVAVFIDGDNVSANNAKVIMREILNFGRIVVSHVYGDWSSSNMSKWKSEAHEHGIINVQCDRLKGKNSTDIKMMLDIMKFLYENNHIKIYCIVTSDADFRHIISEIKLHGKTCYCLGSEQADNSLKSACDKFVKLETLNKIESKIDSKVETKAIDVKVPIEHKLYKKMVEDLYNLCETQESVCMSRIYNLWATKYKLDYREYNFNRFSKFLFHNFGSKLCKVEIGNGSLNVCLRG